MDMDDEENSSIDEEVEILDVEEEIDPGPAINEEDGEDDEDNIEKPSSISKKFDIVSVNELYGSSLSKSKRTRPYLTQFEITKILSIRAQQLENGSPPFIPITDELLNSKSIAYEEYRQKCVPFIVRRYLPNKSYEDWKLSDFKNAYVI